MAATTIEIPFNELCRRNLFTEVPPQPKIAKPGQLSEDMVKQFFEEGFVIVENYFLPKELDACRNAVDKLVDDLALKLYQAGKVKNLHKELGFNQRLTKLEEEFPGANIVLHKQGILPKAMQDLWSNERLLNAIEQLIGPEIAGHPVWNLRTKTPQSAATTVPWHQDVAYLDEDSYNVLTPTAWIPLVDTNEENGCMQVVRKGHISGKVAKHECCAGPTWYVMLDEKEMEQTLGVNLKEDVVLCPVPYGGMLLINNLIPHQSLPNISNGIRWSLDLRWQNPEKPWGFYGLKEGVLMRSSKNPVTHIDWDSFNALDRNNLQSKAMSKVEDEFDTTISGPWMLRWEITHKNHHTASLKGSQTSWH